MARKPPVTLLLLAALSMVAAAHLSAQKRETQLVEDAAEVFRAVISVPEKEVPEFMIRDARGVAIIPAVRKIGLVIGGQRGSGVLLVRVQDGDWSDPVFVNLSGLSFGWQFGVQSLDLVLFFRTRESVDKVLRGALTLGVDVSVAAGSFGRQAGAGTDERLQSEVYSYARSRGFFAGLTLAGSTLNVDEDADAAYYRKRVTAREVFDGSVKTTEPSAAGLRAILERYGRPANP